MSSCIVVGAGPGIGAAVARRFAREGYAVGLIARDAAAVEQLAAELPGEAGAASADAGDPDALAAAVARLTAELGEPDTLVYNAAVKQGDGGDLAPADLGALLGVDVVGALAAAQAVLESMRARGSGTILFTGGGLALYPSPDFLSLSVGKAALRALALTLHEAWKPAGVHVATVTIAGWVGSGPSFEPDAIAEAYWTLHEQQPDAWEAELVHQ